CASGSTHCSSAKPPATTCCSLRARRLSLSSSTPQSSTTAWQSSPIAWHRGGPALEPCGSQESRLSIIDDGLALVTLRPTHQRGLALTGAPDTPWRLATAALVAGIHPLRR